MVKFQVSSMDKSGSTLKDLRPNTDLLDSNFMGYKLSLNSVAMFQLKLDCNVCHIMPSEDQYTFTHAKVFRLHNHLFGDQWAMDDVYFIDNEWKIRKSIFTTHSRHLKQIIEIWEIPNCYERKSGHYNSSLSFPSTGLAIVADGMGSLHIVDTGARSDNVKWKVLFSGEVCEKNPFVIIHSRCIAIEGEMREIHCLLLHIDSVDSDKEAKDSSQATAFITVLEWITFSERESHTWFIKSVRHVSDAGDMYFAVIDDACQSLYLAGNKKVAFTMDTEHPIERNECEDASVVSDPIYQWTQTCEDITIWLKVNEFVTKTEVEVTVESKHLHIKCGNNILLSGPTWHELDTELTTWALHKGKLELSLSKSEKGLIWQELVITDKKGEEIPVESVVKGQEQAHPGSHKGNSSVEGCSPSFNTEQLEECDILSNDTSLLVRLDAESHVITHQVNLSGNQWLFNVQLLPDQVAAICLRHDVDGCLWQPQHPLKNEDWPITHVGTFLAFGYVNASKQKKFCVCPPNMLYVAICESVRHIYIYRQPEPISGELRNRRTGEQVGRIARQQVISLDSSAELLGVHASNEVLFVLTTDTLYALQIT